MYIAASRSCWEFWLSSLLLVSGSGELNLCMQPQLICRGFSASFTPCRVCGGVTDPGLITLLGKPGPSQKNPNSPSLLLVRIKNLKTIFYLYTKYRVRTWDINYMEKHQIIPKETVINQRHDLFVQIYNIILSFRISRYDIILVSIFI